jgi:hypothetical protein
MIDNKKNIKKELAAISDEAMFKEFKRVMG